MTDIETNTTAEEFTVSETLAPAVDPASEPTLTAPAPTPEPEHEPEPKPNAEAAKYRTQLRAAEKARDTALEQMSALQRSIIDRMIEQDHKIKPAAVWANGTTVAELLGKDGTVDPNAVATAVRSAEETLGVLKPPVGVYVPTEGKVPDMSSPATWAGVLNPRSRR